MKYLSPVILFLCLVQLLFTSISAAGTDSPQPENQPDAVNSLQAPLYKPFIERYVLDELKQLRQDQLQLEVRLTEKVANSKLEVSDRAIRYTSDTTNNVFYIITASATILVLLGWKSLHDMRTSIEEITSAKISQLIEEYEARLAAIEQKMKVRSEQILANQEQISLTNNIHSLWMRSALEKSDQEKINIYDQILDLRANDVEALTYKADALLEIGEKRWALSLADQAIAQDETYSLAYWQRACAKAELGMTDEALDDIAVALDLSETFKDELDTEPSFQKLQTHKRFRQLSGMA